MSRPAADQLGGLGHPNFDVLANPGGRWGRLRQKVRARRQQYGEPNVEKRPHLEEHFFAANEDACLQESGPSRLLQETVAVSQFH